MRASLTYRETLGSFGTKNVDATPGSKMVCALDRQCERRRNKDYRSQGTSRENVDKSNKLGGSWCGVGGAGYGSELLDQQTKAWVLVVRGEPNLRFDDTVQATLEEETQEIRVPKIPSHNVTTEEKDATE